MPFGKIIVIAGAPGVGKTTVVNLAVQKAAEKGYTNIEIANYGTAMFEAAKAENLVEERDQMRKLPPEIQIKLQKIAAKKIREKAASGGTLIVDTHMLISTPGGYLVGLPSWVAEELRPDQIILVEADPEDIFIRRLGDDSRNRDIEGTSSLQLHQDLARSTAISCAVLIGSVLNIVYNTQGNPDKAAEKIAKLLIGES
ncbi:MAG: adenylate kinase [Candidatus Odinarchaeum yellowstonii]|uniref:Adenylate kinase n=1 Tax=Odinarchaeota yellowstonii (strain LCB_4) TaxID=1841599 RepID=A0AAF0D1E1_ODILC|nr:MAG: adenylate kinase [Candidatus Odinarchaeum yellowstonii]